MTKKRDQRSKTPYEKIQIVTPSNQLVTILGSQWIKSQFLFKNPFKKVTLYPYPSSLHLISTPQLNYSHTYNTIMVKCNAEGHQCYPSNLSEIQCLGPILSLLGNSDALRITTVFYSTPCCSVFWLFCLHPHAHHCLYIAWSTHTESAQVSWSPQLKAFTDIYPATSSPSSQWVSSSWHLLPWYYNCLLTSQKFRVFYVMDIKWVLTISQALF